MERVDFSEVFTLAARHLVPAVKTRAPALFFDYRGPRVALPIDVSRLRRTLHRLLCGALDCLQSGFVMFIAEAEVHGGNCRLTVNAVGGGHLVEADVIDALLDRLEMHSSPTLPAGNGRKAFGQCPVAGADLEFSCLRGEGLLFRATFKPEDFDVLDDDARTTQPWGPSRAWLISPEDAAADSLTRRLQRLGWAVTRFDSCAHAQVHLSQASRNSRKPELVIIFEFEGAAPSAVLRLRDMLPATTKVSFTVASQSATLRDPEALPGCEVIISPFSPTQLLAYTRSSGSYRAPRSGDTDISPLLFIDRPLVLVVDDNELNRVVTCGLLEALGYEAASAQHGVAAIEKCRRISPHAVLMDIDMPVLDGLDTTRQLRRLQRIGAISPFAIIAVTASESNTLEDQCLGSGMDGYLNKPLRLPQLSAELRRVTLL